MTNYPGLNRGNSQAHSCVAWRAGQSVDTLIAKAGEREEIFLATFYMDDIRAFRKTEMWRIDYRKAWHRELLFTTRKQPTDRHSLSASRQAMLASCVLLFWQARGI